MEVGRRAVPERYPPRIRKVPYLTGTGTLTTSFDLTDAWWDGSPNVTHNKTERALNLSLSAWLYTIHRPPFFPITQGSNLSAP